MSTSRTENATPAEAVGLLTPEEFEALRKIPSPSIANAVETFHLRPRTEGCTNASIRCAFPEMGVMVGYACTAAILSNQPAPAKRLVDRKLYWEYTRNMPGPKITVIQDLSETPGGAYWGEVNSNIHKALGSLGVLTNGTVRDIEEVRRVGFHFFSSGVQVSHGYAHLEDFNRPVKVFGMLVNPGDLIHADFHGAVVIPREIAKQVAARALEGDAAEKPILACCQSPDFSLNQLDELVSREY